MRISTTRKETPTALPKCWIDAFEHYGFYWLGRDPDLRDTMHFEFLGDPELKHRLERRAYDYGRETAWPAVGRRVLALTHHVLDPQAHGPLVAV